MTKSTLITTATQMPLHDLTVVMRKVSDLKKRRRNARRHSKKQVRVVADCIRRLGFTAPILIEPDGTIIAGHCRLEAAKLLGLAEVPTIIISGLAPDQIRALVLADNRLAELARWDEEVLKIEMEELLSSDLDIEVTGFEMADIDRILDFKVQDNEVDKADLSPDDTQGRPVAKRGDVFYLSSHRIGCGDSRDLATYEALMAGEQGEMVFTDPPYNVPVQGHVSGLGSIRHREFAMAVGEMSCHEFTAFLLAVFKLMVRYTVNGSIHYICMDWRHLGELMEAASACFAGMKNLCVWTKTNAGMGSFYRNQHELVAVYKNGTARHINNFGLGESGRHRSNVWTYPGMSSLTRERLDDLKLHPTVKPVALVADAMRDCSNRGGIVLDPFGGSGTTIIAAELTGRRGYAIELDPLYVDTAIRRWQRLTGEIAVRAADGAKFSDLEQE